MAHDRTFSIVLEPQPEGGFTVLVPAFPEIITEGDTEEDALAMAQDAIVSFLKTALYAAKTFQETPIPLSAR